MAAKKKPWKNGYFFHFFLILGVEHVESEANFASFINVSCFFSRKRVMCTEIYAGFIHAVL